MQVYDQVPYPGGAIHDSHPDRLATLAVLHGLTPPDIHTARVLELGCGDGSNLLPMAFSLPDATFVGIDTATTQIAEGRRRAKALGIGNIELNVADILDLAASGAGTFDYVLCHGVFSWVPTDVQKAILQICADALSPDGVAYISYNAMPGWGTRGVVRDLMRLHAGRDGTPADRVSAAKHAVRTVAGLSKDGPWGELLGREAKVLGDKRVGYLFHDHLAEVNEALYLTEFVHRAKGFGLAYLTDAVTTWCTVPQHAREALSELTHSPLRLRQYWDFATNRGFHCSLLVHDSARAMPDLHPPQARLLRVSGRVKPESGEWPALDSDELVAYTTPKDRRFQLGDRRVKAILRALTEAWPATLPVEALAERFGVTNRAVLYASLAEGFRSDFLFLSTTTGRFATTLGDPPVASPLARLQVASGDQWVTSMRHTEVNLGPLSRRVLLHLDGRPLDAVRDALAQDLADGTLVLKTAEGGEDITKPALVETAVRMAVEDKVHVLLNAGLLVA